MIPNNTDAEAEFVHVQPDGSKQHESRPIVGWDDLGQPLVIHGRLLRPAPTLPGFTGLLPPTLPGRRVVQVIPGAGWLLTRPGHPPIPLVAWGLTADGHLMALDTDPDGDVEPLGFAEEYTIHPEGTGPDWRPL